MTNKFEDSIEIFERIERYILAEMEDSELVSFEQELATDKELSKKVEEYRVLITAIEEQSLKTKLDEFHEGIVTETIPVIKKRLFSFPKIGIAAAISFLVAFAGYKYYQNNTHDDSLYETYFVPDPGLPTVMGKTENYAFFDAMVDYKRGNYNTAIKKWKELYSSQTKNDTLNYFLGVAYLTIKKVDPAIKHLQIVSDTENSIFIEDAIYYLGLANLKEGKLEKAKVYFSKTKHPQASKILHSLKN